MVVGGEEEVKTARIVFCMQKVQSPFGNKPPKVPDPSDRRVDDPITFRRFQNHVDTDHVNDITPSGLFPSFFRQNKDKNKMATTVEDAPPQEIVPSASEDAIMDESEEAKAARAVKQGSSSFSPFSCEDWLTQLAVEFYFADANLPFDKYEVLPTLQRFSNVPSDLCGVSTPRTTTTGFHSQRSHLSSV